MAAALHRYLGHGYRRVDWALILVVVMALALFMASVIRSGAPAGGTQFGLQLGGLRALSETETLVTFEPDGPVDPGAWAGGRPNADHVALGSVWLADPPDQPLTRVITLPEGSARALLSFDLVVMGDWSARGLAVSIDGEDVLRQPFGAADQAPPPPETMRGDDRIALRSRITGPRMLSGAPDLSVQRLHLDISVVTPQEAITLTLAPLGTDTGGADPAPSWAVDNLVVVAEGPP